MTGDIILQLDPSVVCSYQACSTVAEPSREDAKVGRSLGWNLVRAEHSRICIYAFVERNLVYGRTNHQEEPNITCDSSKYMRSV